MGTNYLSIRVQMCMCQGSEINVQRAWYLKAVLTQIGFNELEGWQDGILTSCKGYGERFVSDGEECLLFLRCTFWHIQSIGLPVIEDNKEKSGD